jgi:hypothetical protein
MLLRTLSLAALLAASIGSVSAQVAFQNPIPRDQLAFLNQFDGKPSKDLIENKQFRKLLHAILPDCTFHYGTDMPLAEAVDKVIKGSPLPVRIHDSRYLIVSGRMGPYLGGRGFVWIDLQEGIGLGGFYFRPTNGEPSPAVNVFSKQVKEDALAMSQLPPVFAEDLWEWSGQSRIRPVTARYFITGDKKKILLEHDEDYCARVGGSAAAAPQDPCQQMNADAADVDLVAAYYVEQTHHATNATAWMINDHDAVAWVEYRDNTCAAGPNPLACRIVMTRERTRSIIRRKVASN